MLVVRVSRHLVDQRLDVLRRQEAEKLLDVDVRRVQDVPAEVQRSRHPQLKCPAGAERWKD